MLLPLPLGEVASRSDDGEGAARLTGAAPHPALRATFPRWVKASAVAIQFPAQPKTSSWGSWRAVPERVQPYIITLYRQSKSQPGIDGG